MAFSKSDLPASPPARQSKVPRGNGKALASFAAYVFARRSSYAKLSPDAQTAIDTKTGVDVQKSKWLAAFCAGLLLALAASSVFAQSGGPGSTVSRDPAFEKSIYDRLAAINPAAVPVFKSATTAMDGNDNAGARAGFEQVLKLAPDFPDALRRLSYVLGQLNDNNGAVTAAQRAVKVDPSGINLLALSQALLSRNTPADQVAALTQAKAAADKLPNDPAVLFVLGFAGLENHDTAAVKQASSQMLRVAPNSPQTHFINGMRLALAEQWEAAEQELLLSKSLGMPADYIDGVLSHGISSQASLARWERRGVYAIGVWVVGLLALFAGGSLLSRLTLAAINRPSTPGQRQLSRSERRLRSVYRLVIGITSTYFYLSIPFLIVIVLALALVIVAALLGSGVLPIYWLAVLAVAVLYTLIALVRSLFTRPNNDPPGRPLPRSQAPDLWNMAESIAQRLETQAIDAIYVTPGVEVAVLERGQIVSKLRGSAERALVLGLGTLPGMTRGQLRAILAHEYGHFSNRDTAGGTLVRRVQVSILGLARGLARSRVASWLNPAWIFVNIFNRIFLRVTLGASRLQEVLADRYAVMAFGVRDFSEGLTHVVRQSLIFGPAVQQEIETANAQQRGLDNVYQSPAANEANIGASLEAKLKQVMTRPTSAYDSHPALQDRLRLVTQAGAPMLVEEDTRPAWELISDPEALQLEMTKVIQDRLRK